MSGKEKVKESTPDPRSVTVTDSQGNLVELGAIEVLAFLQSLPDKFMNAPVIVGGSDEKSAYGFSVVKISLDFEKGGPVILLELEEVDTE